MGDSRGFRDSVLPIFIAFLALPLGAADDEYMEEVIVTGEMIESGVERDDEDEFLRKRA